MCSSTSPLIRPKRTIIIIIIVGHDIIINYTRDYDLWNGGHNIYIIVHAI